MAYYRYIDFANICVLLICVAAECFAGMKPCQMRAVPGESVVCVCNDTYCDNVIREQPHSNNYIAYTSSKAGSRFKKSKGVFRSYLSIRVNATLELDPETTYQTIEGFGGAVTDSAGINWRNLSDPLQKYLIESYFSDRGLEYNMLRVPIGGCDFSTHPYAYNEQPPDDILLANFNLTYEDYQYKIPMIKAALAASNGPIHIIGSSWSPPLWMKTIPKYSGNSFIKRKYFQTYADYHYKFIEKYLEKDIPIWGITTTNEPSTAAVPTIRINNVGWTPESMAEWIENNLGPTIRNSAFKDLKIMAIDDQRFSIPYWLDQMNKTHPQALEYVDGVAVHYYADQITPTSFLQYVTDSYPGKFIINTESSEGNLAWETNVVLGSWDRARNYIYDILTDLHYNVIGWLDWNLCLNEEGGPNWVSNFVDSPIIVSAEKKEFMKQPTFYAMGHFSKFIPRGSRRINVIEKIGPFTMPVYNVAFLTPQNTVVIILYNNNDNNRKIGIKLNKRKALLTMEAHSVVTVEFNYK